MTHAINDRSTETAGDTDVVGARALAQLVDGIVSTLLFALVTGGIVLSTGGVASGYGTLVGTLIAVGPSATFVGLLAAGTLSVLLEWLWNGETVGKRLVGIRVVSLDGDAVSLRAALARNVVATVDAAFFYLVGLASMVASSERQRIGDRVAGTTVVRR